MASQIDETPSIDGGKRYRLVVSSAEEAVKVIREKLGEKARVISVKQIDGQGLARFLTSPKLEVIVTVPTDSSKESESNTQAKDSQTQHPNDEAQRQKATQETSDRRSRDIAVKSGSSLATILNNAGFDQDLMNRLESHPKWSQLQGMPIAHALSDISSYLKNEYASLRVHKRGNRIAFLGTPGVGKTTALCKLLVNEVFFKQHRVHVLKLDNDVPNADDALRVFCEVLGVPLYRHAEELKKVPDTDLIFYDVPGLRLDQKDWMDLNIKLDQFKVNSRVLVLNSAYDAEVMKKTIRLGEYARTTHMIFTHVDELSNPTKLWSLVFNSGLTSLLLCHGQSITDDFSENILQYLLTNTFPRHLLGR